jgi:hypothetical protein
MDRKLAAVLAAYLHGYSRLMGKDAEATLRALTAHRKLIYTSRASRSDACRRRNCDKSLNRGLGQ